MVSWFFIKGFYYKGRSSSEEFKFKNQLKNIIDKFIKKNKPNSQSNSNQFL